MQDARTCHIGLLWHSCFSENLGVGALSVANANMIGAAAVKAGLRPALHLMGVRGAMDYRGEIVFENDFTNIGYKALANPISDLNRTIRRCAMLFDIGGGDSFSDIYAARRFGLIVGSKYAGKLQRRSLVLSPQTIGPFHADWAKKAAAMALHGAERVFARDEPSLAAAQLLGSEAVLTTDVAFALPYDPPERSDGPLKVGLNVSALLYRRNLAKGDRIALALHYPALIHAMIDRVAGNPAIELHLVPHVLAQHTAFEDDHAVAEDLHARYPQTILPPRFTGPSDAKSYIAALDLFAGSRMHACIAALSSGVAVLPLGYSRKFTGLFGSLNYEHTADLTCEDGDAVLAKWDAALGSVESLKAQAVDATRKVEARLATYRDYLDEAFARHA